MNRENTEFFKLIEEWFITIPDKTEKGFRELLKGERPIDAGTSVTHKVSSESALLLYNYDLDTIIYKLRRKFSESVIFNRAEIKYLNKTFNLDDSQAEAVYFLNLLILRNEFVRDQVKIYEEFLASILSSTFKTIDQEGVSDALKKFRKVSSKTKNIFVEGVGLTYIERLKQNAHLFIKTPNVGRPIDREEKTEKITLAIKELFDESLNSKNESNKNDILSGKIVPSRITKSKVALQLKISRPQFNKWLNATKLDFEELVNSVQSEFYQSLRNQMSKQKQ